MWNNLNREFYRNTAAHQRHINVKKFLGVRGWDKGFARHVLLAEKNRLMHLFSEYIQYGGFPEVVREENRKIKTILLKDYYNAILTRDVLRRYPVRHTARYESAAHYLISNPTSPFSAKKLAPAINITQHIPVWNWLLI